MGNKESHHLMIKTISNAKDSPIMKGKKKRLSVLSFSIPDLDAETFGRKSILEKNNYGKTMESFQTVNKTSSY